MKFFKLFLLNSVLLSSLLFFNACQTDDVSDDVKQDLKEDENQEETKNTLTVTDLAVTINENLESDSTIETISATTTTGTITYTVKSTTVEGAIKIESDGAIKIDDNALIDYETHTEIKVVVTVSNGTEMKDITITITILDVDETLEEEKEIVLGALDKATISKAESEETFNFEYLTEDFEMLGFSISELPTSTATYNLVSASEVPDHVTTTYLVYRDKNYKAHIATSGTVKVSALGNDRYSVEITNAIFEEGQIKSLSYELNNPLVSKINISSALHGNTTGLPKVSITAVKVNDIYYLQGSAKDEGFSGGQPFLKEFSISVQLPKGDDITTTSYGVTYLIGTTEARIEFTYKSLNPTTIKTYYAKAGAVNITRDGDKFSASFTDLETVEFKSLNFIDVDNKISGSITGLIED